MAKSDKTVKRGVYLYIDGKEIKNDINSIDFGDENAYSVTLRK